MNGPSHRGPVPTALNAATQQQRPPVMNTSSAVPQGIAPTAPNGTAPRPAAPRPRIRRRKEVDPLRPVQRPLKKIAHTIQSMPTVKPKTAEPPADRHAYTTSAAVAETQAQGFKMAPLVITKRQMLDGLRHHVMKLQHSARNGSVDIMDQSQFTRPIRLHRRDPRAPPSGAGANVVEEDEPEDIEEAKEKERLEMVKEERRRIKEENMAKIAPSTTKKPPAFQKKTAQIYRDDTTEEAQKRAKLRYEEALPWHLEDFDNKQTWVGSYEGQLSETHVTLEPAAAPQGAGYELMFRMTPVEKWYKFIAKGKGKIITAEEAEEVWKKNGKVPQYLKNIESISFKREQEEKMNTVGPGRMRTRVAGAGDDDPSSRRFGGDDDLRVKVEADADDIDFNMEEDFADDEEGLNGLFDGDEADSKEAAEKLKRDHLAARVFELRNEEDIERQEAEERERAQQAKKLQKSVRKALLKREKNYDYESSDSNPYSSSSESESEEESEQKKEEDKKAGDQNSKGKEPEKPTSGTSSKGNTTPSGNHKAVEINKKKRAGTPTMSEASGNESSRKKHKKKHDPSRKSSLAPGIVEDRKRPAGAMSGSESEVTDAGKKKQKLMISKSPTGTPGQSRAASPDSNANLPQSTNSRASSPTAVVRAQRALDFPTPTEIWEAIPKTGIPVASIIKTFADRIKGNGRHKAFIQVVRKMGVLDNVKRLIVPHPEMPPLKAFEPAYRLLNGNAGTSPAS